MVVHGIVGSTMREYTKTGAGGDNFHVGSFVPLKRARRHGRRIAHTQLRRPLILLLEILLGQRTQPGAVFLLDDRSLAVKLLDVFEPGDAVADPSTSWLEPILQNGQYCAKTASPW